MPLRAGDSASQPDEVGELGERRRGAPAGLAGGVTQAHGPGGLPREPAHDAEREAGEGEQAGEDREQDQRRRRVGRDGGRARGDRDRVVGRDLGDRRRLGGRRRRRLRGLRRAGRLRGGLAAGGRGRRRRLAGGRRRGLAAGRLLGLLLGVLQAPCARAAIASSIAAISGAPYCLRSSGIELIAPLSSALRVVAGVEAAVLDVLRQQPRVEVALSADRGARAR